MTTFILGGELINVPGVLSSKRNSECKSREVFFFENTRAVNILKTRPFTESKHGEKAFVSKIKIKISYWVKCNGLC